MLANMYFCTHAFYFMACCPLRTCFLYSPVVRLRIFLLTRAIGSQADPILSPTHPSLGVLGLPVFCEELDPLRNALQTPVWHASHEASLLTLSHFMPVPPALRPLCRNRPDTPRALTAKRPKRACCVLTVRCMPLLNLLHAVSYMSCFGFLAILNFIILIQFSLSR